MEAAIVGAVLKSTLPLLFKVIDERNKKRARGKWREKVNDNLESIKSELELIRAAIRDHKDTSNDISHLRRTRIEQLRRLAYKIEDCLDDFLAEKVNDKEFVNMLTHLNKLAEETHEKFLRYTSEETTQETKIEVLEDEDSSDLDHGVVLGMEEPSDELMALMGESSESSERKLRVIFIVGFGGMGKTLLANRIYREQCSRFPRHAFVRVAGRGRKEVLKEITEQLEKQEKTQQQEITEKFQQCKVNSGWKTIIQRFLDHGQQDLHGDVHWGGSSTDLPQLGANGIHDDASASSEDIHVRLTSCLGSNRYMIVIDDIRAEDVCNGILSAFPQGKEVDSRIIVTTTIESVAQSCSAGNRHVYKMRPLNDEMSRTLFMEIACRGKSPSIPSEQQSLEFRNKCDGVPLALVSIAQYCNGELIRCEEAWKKLCKSETGNKKNKLSRMQRVLDHSYDSLSSHVLQDCLLYFCMFPWGYHVKTGALIRRWLAEGLALPEDGSGFTCSVDAAVRNLNTLLDRNVIWSSQVSINGDVKTCQPPGVMLGYLTIKSESESFVMLSCDTPNPQDIRRLSLHHTGVADNVRLFVHKDLSRLRTLAVFNSNIKKGEKNSLSFAKCLLLRVLDLEACHGLKGTHLDEICKLLRLLKYLSLGAGITELPRTIEKLKLLETLHISKEKLVTVPVEVLELPHLKHLIGKLQLCRGDGGTRKLEKFLSEGSKLQTVTGFVTGSSRTAGFPRLMGHMGSLRKVKIWCSSNASPQNLSDLAHSIKAFLSKAESTPRIPHALSVDLDECSVQFLNSVLAPGYLPGENHPGGLSSLKLRGMLTPVPGFVTNLRGITTLCLSSATLSWNAIVVGLSNLKILEYLKLVADNNIEGDVVVQREEFISLKRMWVVADQSVPRITIQAGALKHLVSLHLLFLVQDANAARQILLLESLREISLHSAVAQETWKEAARDHPNRPSVVFINKT